MKQQKMASRNIFRLVKIYYNYNFKMRNTCMLKECKHPMFIVLQSINSIFAMSVRPNLRLHKILLQCAILTKYWVDVQYLPNIVKICNYDQEEFEDTKGVIRIRKSKKNKQQNIVQMCTFYQMCSSYNVKNILTYKIYTA